MAVLLIEPVCRRTCHRRASCSITARPRQLHACIQLACISHALLYVLRWGIFVRLFWRRTSASRGWSLHIVHVALQLRLTYLVAVAANQAYRTRRTSVLPIGTRHYYQHFGQEFMTATIPFENGYKVCILIQSIRYVFIIAPPHEIVARELGRDVL